MAKSHCVGDGRACGAVTVGTGLNEKVFVGGKLAAVVGDLDSHNMLGALVSMSPGTVLIRGIPMIASLMDQGSPDVMGIVPHVEGLPTPVGGNDKVQLYGNLGGFGGGLGSFGLTGLPQVGELLSFAGNIVGQVYRTANQGGNTGLLAMNNVTSNTQPTTGQTVTGVTTGRTFTFSSYYTS